MATYQITMQVSASTVMPECSSLQARLEWDKPPITNWQIQQTIIRAWQILDPAVKTGQFTVEHFKVIEFTVAFIATYEVSKDPAHKEVITGMIQLI